MNFCSRTDGIAFDNANWASVWSGFQPARPRGDLEGCDSGNSDLLARNTARLVARQSGAMKPEDLELLVTREMPFGKHKGRVIADLPGNYLNWFAREGFPPGEIGRLLALMQEIDHNGLKDILVPLRQRSGR
jgi:uncharacterized protein (DUF3820 family)